MSTYLVWSEDITRAPESFNSEAPNNGDLLIRCASADFSGAVPNQQCPRTAKDSHEQDLA